MGQAVDQMDDKFQKKWQQHITKKTPMLTEASASKRNLPRSMALNKLAPGFRNTKVKSNTGLLLQMAHSG
jgi:hypothetical protein